MSEPQSEDPHRDNEAHTDSDVSDKMSISSVYGIPELSVTKIQTSDSIGPPPDGGMIAWMQVAAGFLCSFNSWGIVNAYGVYQSYYGSHGVLEGESPGDIAWIGALMGALTMIGCSFFGFLLDAGYIKHLAYAGCIVNAFSLMMLSLSTQYYQVILTQGLLTGLCGAVLFLVGIGAVGPYFSTKRALGMGIAAAGSATGGIVYSVMARRLFPMVGYPWATRILGFVELALGLIAATLIKRRLPPRKRGGFIALESFTDPPFLLYCIGTTFSFIGMYIFLFLYQDYATSLRPNSNVSIYMTAIINGAQFFGRLIPGYLADHIGPFNIVVPACALSAILTFCWIPAKSEGSIIAIAVLLGFTSGTVPALPGTVAAKLTPKLNRLGVRLSFILLFSGVGVLLGAPFAGIMVRKYGYFWAKVYSGIGWSIATLFMFASHRVQSKGKWFVKV